MLFRLQQFDKYNKIVFFVVATIILYLALTALPNYPGEASVYIFFTIISNALLMLVLVKMPIFFDVLLGYFFGLDFGLS